jgi:hypothetical protein
VEDFSDLVDDDGIIDITPTGRAVTTAKQVHTDALARRERFARAYLENGCDGFKALDAIGMAKGHTPSQRTARATAMLAHPDTRAALKRILEPAIKKSNLTIERTLMQIAAVAQFDKRKLYNEDGTRKHPSELDAETAAAISHIGKDDYVPFDKLKALDMSMKYLGAYEKDNSQKTPNLALQVVLV